MVGQRGDRLGDGTETAVVRGLQFVDDAPHRAFGRNSRRKASSSGALAALIARSKARPWWLWAPAPSHSKHPERHALRVRAEDVALVGARQPSQGEPAPRSGSRTRYSLRSTSAIVSRAALRAGTTAPSTAMASPARARPVRAGGCQTSVMHEGRVRSTALAILGTTSW